VGEVTKDDIKCDSSGGIETFNPTCGYNTDHPYCRQITPLTSACRECISSCDCEVNEFCSTALTTLGTCLPFNIEGSACLPFTWQQIEDDSYDQTYKCAILFTDALGDLEIDQAGVCINRICRMCNYRVDGGMNSCGVHDGVKGERECVYPGYLKNTHSMNWSPGPYFEQPENVWWAVLFVFLCFFLSFQVITMVTNVVIMKQGAPFNQPSTNILQ